MKERKGIIMAGGLGTRLNPFNQIISKHLLPVYDKPMIYYPLSLLISCGIKDILIITTKPHLKDFKKTLTNSYKWNINIQYEIQEEADGILTGLIIGEKFLNQHPSALILGDNFFYGEHLIAFLKKTISSSLGATIFGYPTKNHKDFGIVYLNKHNEIINIEEKPKRILYQDALFYAITGLYLYDQHAPEYAKKINRSERNEYEITDLNKYYLKHNNLECKVLKDCTWFDMGTFDNLFKASVSARNVEYNSYFFKSFF